MRKLLASAAILFAITGSALAYGDHADWRCDNGVMVTNWKDEYLIWHEKDYHILVGKTNGKVKGEVSLKLRWDAHSSKVWLNGKECHFITDEEYYKEWCEKEPNNPEACSMSK